MSEQVASTAAAPSNENGAQPESASLEPQERNKGFRRRILHLVEETFGASPRAQIDGLIKTRKGAQIVIQSDEELERAYARGCAAGRADLEQEIKFEDFKKRSDAFLDKYPDFEHTWAAVRDSLPRSIWQEVADNDYGLEGAYWLTKTPELCRELSGLDSEEARERFRFFIKVLKALKRAGQ
jgi:hypothetical protein